MKLFVLLVAFLLTVVLGVCPVVAQTGVISGTVRDAENGVLLNGANVRVKGTTQGSATGIDGAFTIEGLALGGYLLLVSYTGYQNAELPVTVVAEDTVWVHVVLNPGIELDPIQITADRRQEKVLEAPASISVVGGHEIEADAPHTAVKVLRNVVGVDMAQSGIDRHEVVLRGFNNAFSTATYVLTDYRQANAAVIGVNVHSIMPSLPIDIKRAEVVRGPGSALYGAGVDAGVIHYITKDAFSYPGLTVTATGGERSLLNFQGRIAGTVQGKLGLKVTGIYGRANDFELESCTPEVLQEKAFEKCPDPHDAQQLYIDGPRDSRFSKGGINGYMEYRFGKSTALHLNAGYSTVNMTALSGIGTLQGVNYASSFGQVRVHSGPFFAQAFLNSVDSNESYVYNGDPLDGYPTQVNVQAQYDLPLGQRHRQLVIGTDFEFLYPNSGGSLYDENEGKVNLQELGVYAQSNTLLSEDLRLVAALRGDYHSVFESVQLSPRVGLVLNPTTAHSFRATYNRSFVNPSVTVLFLDLVAARLPIGPDAYIDVRGRGGIAGYTWHRNTAYEDLGAPTDLVATSIIPGLEGVDMPVGVETDLVYGFVYDALVDMPNEELANLLIEHFGIDPLLLPILVSQMETIKELLHPDKTAVEGFSAGQLHMLNLSTQSLEPIPNELSPLRGVEEQISQTYEVGYKGILGDRMLLAIDVYHARKKNFVSDLQLRTPFVVVPTLGADLTRDLANGIAGNEDLISLLDLVSTFTGLDLTSEAAAEALVGVAAGTLPDASTPVAVVQTVETHEGVGNLPDLLMTYSSFGNISYYGADVSVQVLASERLEMFSNFSWVSDDFFDHTETGHKDKSSVLALNAPAFKVKIGGSYEFGMGLSVRTSCRYVGGFKVLSGQYNGKVEPYFLVDLGIGYNIIGGLRADFSVSNLTNNLHREFVGAPKIGRVATLRLLFSQGW